MHPAGLTKSGLNKQAQLFPVHDLVLCQIMLLEDNKLSNEIKPQELRGLYEGTIMLCAEHDRQEAFEFLRELLTEHMQQKIYTGALVLRAELFTRAICKLLQHKFHHQCAELYAEAANLGVWEHAPEHQKTVLAHLSQVGYHF